jgi:hypothetical protein
VTSSGVALGGAFTAVGGQTNTRLEVVNRTTGSPTAFTGSVSSTVRALASDSSGRLYVGGAFTKVNGQVRAGLAAFNGSTFTTWAPRAAGGAVLSLHSANGWVLAGGTFTSINATSGSGHLAALNPTSGAVITSWNAPLSVPVHDMDSNSNTVYAAADGAGGQLSAFTLTNGSRRWTVSTDGGVQAVAVWGSEVYFGGHFDRVGTVQQRKLALVSTSGTLQGWNPGTNSIQGVFALTTNQTKLGAGGAFTTFKNGTISQPHFAQFH